MKTKRFHMIMDRISEELGLEERYSLFVDYIDDACIKTDNIWEIEIRTNIDPKTNKRKNDILTDHLIFYYSASRIEFIRNNPELITLWLL